MESSSSEQSVEADPFAGADDIYRTPLGPKDPEKIEAFWTQFLSDTGRPPSTPVALAFCFGDTVELADELIQLVVDGTKRATAGSVAEMEAEGEPLPEIGDLYIIMDGSMEPRLVLETTDTRVGPLSSVDDQFAWDEGEGDRSRDYWLKAHHWFFRRSFKRLGLEFHDDIPVSFERFDVVYNPTAESGGQRA